MVLDFTNATFIEKVYPFLIYARATEPPTIHPTAAPIAPPTTELPTAVPITEPIIVQTAEVIAVTESLNKIFRKFYSNCSSTFNICHFLFIHYSIAAWHY